MVCTVVPVTYLVRLELPLSDKYKSLPSDSEKELSFWVLEMLSLDSHCICSGRKSNSVFWPILQNVIHRCSIVVVSDLNDPPIARNGQLSVYPFQRFWLGLRNDESSYSTVSLLRWKFKNRLAVERYCRSPALLLAEKILPAFECGNRKLPMKHGLK